MKNLVSIHILFLLFFIACANNHNQIPKSLSSSYDGIWDGYAQIPERNLYIKAEIKNGIVSGIIEDSANEKQTGFYEDRKPTYQTANAREILKKYPNRRR